MKAEKKVKKQAKKAVKDNLKVCGGVQNKTSELGCSAGISGAVLDASFNQPLDYNSCPTRML